MITGHTQQQFAKNGFVKLDTFLALSALSKVKQVVNVFHHAWCTDNCDFYETSAINSPGLTSEQYLTEAQRLVLFTLISDMRLLEAVNQVIHSPVFTGTQLFLDPFNTKLANFWHRDPQYHLTVEEQKVGTDWTRSLTCQNSSDCGSWC
jgi:hypothetical protein